MSYINQIRLREPFKNKQYNLKVFEMNYWVWVQWSQAIFPDHLQSHSSHIDILKDNYTSDYSDTIDFSVNGLSTGG